MYVGHALLGFALGALAADRLGIRRSRVITVGLVAGGFALLPDVDAAHTAYVVLQAGPRDLFPTPVHVWTPEAWQVHRALTHSVLVGGVTSLGVLLLGGAHRWRREALPVALVSLVAGSVAFGSILWIGVSTDGLAGAATAGLYLTGAVVLAGWAIRQGVSPVPLGGAAALGLLTHPFGDLFMGLPPAFLYPLTSVPPIPKQTLSPDPTVNLVLLFCLELALGWAALATVSAHQGWNLRGAIEPHAVLALGFGAAVLVIQPPTLHVAYHFAVGTIAAGLIIGVVPGVVGGRRSSARTARSYRSAVVTGLTAVTLAVTAYLLTYLAIRP